MKNNRLRGLYTVVLVCIAVGIGFVGRLVLNYLIDLFPSYTSLIEQVGGWLVGMIAGAVALIPIFNMYGVFEKHSDRK